MCCIAWNTALDRPAKQPRRTIGPPNDVRPSSRKARKTTTAQPRAGCAAVDRQPAVRGGVSRRGGLRAGAEGARGLVVGIDAVQRGRVFLAAHRRLRRWRRRGHRRLLRVGGDATEQRGRQQRDAGAVQPLHHSLPRVRGCRTAAPCKGVWARPCAPCSSRQRLRQRVVSYRRAAAAARKRAKTGLTRCGPAGRAHPPYNTRAWPC